MRCGLRDLEEQQLIIVRLVKSFSYAIVGPDEVDWLSNTREEPGSS